MLEQSVDVDRSDADASRAETEGDGKVAAKQRMSPLDKTRQRNINTYSTQDEILNCLQSAKPLVGLIVLAGGNGRSRIVCKVANRYVEIHPVAGSKVVTDDFDHQYYSMEITSTDSFDLVGKDPSGDEYFTALPRYRVVGSSGLETIEFESTYYVITSRRRQLRSEDCIFQTHS